MADELSCVVNGAIAHCARRCRRVAGLLATLVPAACVHLPGGDAGIPLRATSYNIAAGHGDLDRTVTVLRALDADVIALQEVDVFWSARSSFVDQAALLAERLGMHARFAPIYRLAGADAAARPREYGLVLLSRYPIVEFRNHALTRLSTQDAAASPQPMPGFLEAHVEVRGTLVRIFNAHLDYRPDPSVRNTQVAEMLRIIGAVSSPTLLLGDLNAPPDAPELQPLLARLGDTWTQGAGPALTYPATAPVKRIDFVLASSHFRMIAHAVPDSDASDHRPVTVDVVLRAQTTR